jgi:hypothetical protein
VSDAGYPPGGIFYRLDAVQKFRYDGDCPSSPPDHFTGTLDHIERNAFPVGSTDQETK